MTTNPVGGPSNPSATPQGGSSSAWTRAVKTINHIWIDASKGVVKQLYTKEQLQKELGIAIISGNLNKVKFLLSCGAALNEKDKDGRMPLICAAINGHLNIVELLLDRGVDPNQKDKDGSTPLIVAAMNGHLNIVELLLDRGADPNQEDKDGRTPLIVALKSGQFEFVKLLLDRGVDPNQKDENGQTPLIVAGMMGRLNIVELLLDRGVNPNQEDKDGQTPLIVALKSGRFEFVKLLLDRGVDPNQEDKSGTTPLICAANVGHINIVELLLDRGVDPNQKDKDGKTPLMFAAMMGHLNIVELLLDRGLDPNQKDKDGRTPLMFAAMMGHLNTVELLLDRGVDPNQEMEYEGTPLTWAAVRGHANIVELLLDRGAVLEQKGKDGGTPLTWAAIGGHANIVELLLVKGADLEQKDKGGRTPLTWAAVEGHANIVELLLDKGADFEQKDKDGRTPLTEAASNSHLSIVELLLAKGADPNLRDTYLRTPLHEAIVKVSLYEIKAAFKHVKRLQETGFEVAKRLLEAGAEPNPKDKDGKTPMMLAASNGHLSIVELLLEGEVDPNLKDKDGKTAMMLAASNGHSIIVKLLLEGEVDPNLKDKDGKTAMMLAASNGHLDIVELLLDKGANPNGIDLNQKDRFGRSLLRRAVLGRCLRLVELLLNRGVDPNLKDKDGRTPLMEAVSRDVSNNRLISNDLHILELLLNKGANLNLEDSYGINPMISAFLNERWDVLSFFVDKGFTVSIPNYQIHSRIVQSGFPRDERFFKVLKLNTTLVDVSEVESKGFDELYKLFASRGIILIHEESIIGKESEIKAFLNCIESYKELYEKYSYALVSNPHIPLTKEAFMRLVALSKNAKIENRLFIALQGGATLEELEEAANYSGGKNSIEWLNHCIIFRKKEGLAFAEKVLRQPKHGELSIKALRFLERVETSYHEKMEGYEGVYHFENVIGNILFASLEKIRDGTAIDLEERVVNQALVTLSRMDTTHYKEEYLPTFFQALVHLCENEERIPTLSKPLMAILKAIQNYSLFAQFNEHPEWVDLCLKLSSIAKKHQLKDLGLELGKTLSLLPEERVLKEAYSIVNSPLYSGLMLGKEDSHLVFRGDFDLIRYRPIEHDSKENISRRILDRLSEIYNFDVESEYQAFLKNPSSFKDIENYRTVITEAPLRSNRYMEALFLPPFASIFRGIGARKGNGLLEVALIDLLEKGASDVDLSSAKRDSGTWAKIKHLFTSLDSQYVIWNSFFEDGGALMTIKPEFVNRQILARQVRNAAESGSLHYVFYNTIPLDAISQIFLPRDLFDQVLTLSKLKIDSPRELKRAMALPEGADPKMLYRLYKALQYHSNNLLPKLVPYSSLGQVKSLLPKEATFAQVVEENVKRFIGRKLALGRLTKSKL